MIILHLWLISRLWPGKKNWERNSSYDQEAVIGLKADHWRTPENQKAGDWFMLSIAKPHRNRRERVISEIQFMQCPFSAAAFPLKYTISISNKYGFIPGWVECERGEDDFTKGILVKFDHPLKVSSFIAKITEPRQGVYWGVDRLRVQEVRLFGRWWRKEIGHWNE